jgi:hypothetical protein
MARLKPEGEEPKRRPSIPLPPWWMNALRRECAGMTKEEIAERLNAIAKPKEPFTRSVVSDFLLGKSTPREVMEAFCAMFPHLPPPVFWASTYEEADQHRRLEEKLRAPLPPSPRGAAKGTPVERDADVDTDDKRRGR